MRFILSKVDMQINWLDINNYSWIIKYYFIITFISWIKTVLQWIYACIPHNSVLVFNTWKEYSYLISNTSTVLWVNLKIKIYKEYEKIHLYKKELYTKKSFIQRKFFSESSSILFFWFKCMPMWQMYYFRPHSWTRCSTDTTNCFKLSHLLICLKYWFLSKKFS